ncbi:uncharacterized protein LOC143371097 [Andrena cerasifolii]|uniref:uncharacterized protein LOC143371097 n=1 Tax=Andrena cerasifolii TaxID=2819439 RepID=UPI0040382C90
MRLLILIAALISTTIAQRGPQRSSRTPQAQIRYNDPNGLKVNWKFFVPPNQVRPLVSSQRAERGQPLHPQQLQQPLQQHLQQPLQQHLQQPLQQQLQQHLQQPLQQQLQQPLQQQLQQPLQQHLQQAPQQHLQQAPQSQLVQQQGDPEHQIQYNAYSQVPAPTQAHAELNQVQYKAYQQVEAPAEAQSDPSQLQYKATTQAELPAEAQPDLNQISYKPYSEAPANVKQLLYENSKSQRPYVDPIGILYNPNYEQQFEQQSATAELPQYEKSYDQAEQQKSRRDYSSRGLQGRIVYKDEQPQQQQLSQLPQLVQVPVPVDNIPMAPAPKLLLDKNMPAELQQLLVYQAQAPYDVIANGINYRPKTLFVPEQLPENGKGPYSYRSRTYYVHNDQYQPIYDSSKPVHEEQRL